MVGFVVICVLLAFLTFIGFVAINDGGWFMFINVALVLWVTIENKTTKWDDPVVFPHSDMSIMIDDEVAILRYNGEIKTFSNVKDYNAIKRGDFDIIETKEYDILGEYNGSTYEFIITYGKED